MPTERATFYVGLITTRNYIQWVTRVNMAHRLTEWEEYTKAAPMPLYIAKEVVSSLRANGYDAIMVREAGNRFYANRRVFDNGGN